MEMTDAGRRLIDGRIDPVEWALRVELACLFRINAHLGWEKVDQYPQYRARAR